MCVPNIANESVNKMDRNKSVTKAAFSGVVEVMPNSVIKFKCTNFLYIMYGYAY